MLLNVTLNDSGVELLFMATFCWGDPQHYMPAPAANQTWRWLLYLLSRTVVFVLCVALDEGICQHKVVEH